MAGKTDRLVASPQPLEKLRFHDTARLRQAQAGGRVDRFMGSTLVPEADMTLLVREVREVPDSPESISEAHSHDVSEIYAYLGELTVEVYLDDEKHVVEAPATIFVPPGVAHRMRVVKGSGYAVVILRTGEYE